MAKKKAVIEQLDEKQLKIAIEELNDLKAEIKEKEKEYDALAAQVMATMPVGDVRQYGLLRCVIVQNVGRGISWKAEAGRLAKMLFPKAVQFRAYLRELAKRFPKTKKSAAYPKLTLLKGDEE